MAAFVALGGDAGYIQFRGGPPQPLGPGASFFPVSAATPLSLSPDAHPSGYFLRIGLDNPHPGNPFRTNEQVFGQLKIYSKPGAKKFVISKLSLRVYFESRTLFMGLVPKQSGGFSQKVQKVKSTVAQDYESVTMHEVHRGVVPSGNLTLSWEVDSQLEVALEPKDDGLETSLPFSFTIPRRMTVTEYNEYSGAPRKLCYVPRCPPPTLRDSSVGSVQWVVEAIMDLAPDVLVQEDKGEMMLLQPNDQRVLTRLVFPVIPTLEDVAPLRKQPLFGKDLYNDLFGSRLLDEEGGLGRKMVMAREGKWEAYTKEIAVLEKYNVCSEVYMNSGSQLSTDALTFPLILFLKHTSTRASSLPSFLRSSKLKDIHLVQATVVFQCITSTRGGKEVKPHTRTVTVRQHEIRFDSTSSSSTSGLVIPTGGAAPLEVDLTFDVQAEEVDPASGKQPYVPAKNLTPSFRTPNIELEYYMTVSLLFGEDKVKRIATQFPVQVVPGSTDKQLPPFQDTLPEYTAS